MGVCPTHPGAYSTGTCRSCLGEFCGVCLVYSYGGSKAPFCVRCALSAAAAADGSPHDPGQPSALSA